MTGAKSVVSVWAKRENDQYFERLTLFPNNQMVSKFHHPVMCQSSLILGNNLIVLVDTAASTDLVHPQVYYRKTGKVMTLEEEV